VKNTQTITLILLSVSAVILAGILVGTWQDSNVANAGYASVSKGDYIMVPYEWTDAIDLMIVIDVSTHKMNIYFYDTNKPGVDKLGIQQPTIDLDKVFITE
jgi:hypothetical protein